MSRTQLLIELEEVKERGSRFNRDATMSMILGCLFFIAAPNVPNDFVARLFVAFGYIAVISYMVSSVLSIITTYLVFKLNRRLKAHD